MNCKPGDLAVIVNCSIPVNNGMIVKVLNAEHRFGRHFWRVHPTGQIAHQTIASPTITFDSTRDTGLISDCYLQPIRGNQKQDTEIKELELVK